MAVCQTCILKAETLALNWLVVYHFMKRESKLKVFIVGDSLLRGFWPYASPSSNDNATYLSGPQFPHL